MLVKHGWFPHPHIKSENFKITEGLKCVVLRGQQASYLKILRV